MKIPLITPRQIERLRQLDLLEKKINAQLMDWDPIGVGRMEGFEHNLWEEYLMYIPKLKEALQNGEPIKPVLDSIERESIGYFYTSEDRRAEISRQIELLASKYF